MKVDRLTFASTIGYLNPSGLTVMWMFFLVTCYFYTEQAWFPMSLAGIITSACAYLIWKSYSELPKEVTILHVRFGEYEEMGDFGSCYAIPSCWVTYKLKDGYPHKTRIEEPKGRVRKELVKWRNAQCKSQA